jgi:hypothetical protein
MPPDISRLRQSIIDFVNFPSWRNPIAVTLTLKQRITILGGSLSINKDRCSQNFHHFLNRLNRQLFGNRARRYGKSIPVFSVIEESADSRTHIHSLIDRPESVSIEEYKALITHSWKETDWGYNHIHFDENPNEGWIWYMTKPSQKTEFDLSIDWTNYRKPDC